ncbi:MAG: 3-oxoacid CoA-transferase subunit A, partial [Synergistaceae bacterium]|nr:3-oxoacid CoA-transferase subunit A [Synergistaceae bacterium]
MTKPFIKPIITPEEAAGKVREGSTIMLGGFNYGGVPYTVIDALHDRGTGNIRVISVDASHCNPKVPGPVGVARLIANRQISSMVISHMGLNTVIQEMIATGEIEVELNPMGTLAERIRAGGAGLGGFLTPAGVDTVYEKNRQTVELDGKKFILERPLRADISFIRAYKADQAGNLIYYGTGRNFNPVMATAADVVIAEVDEVLPIGDIDPNNVVTPGLFIDALVLKG